MDPEDIPFSLLFPLKQQPQQQTVIHHKRRYFKPLVNAFNSVKSKRALYKAMHRYKHITCLHKLAKKVYKKLIKKSIVRPLGKNTTKKHKACAHLLMEQKIFDRFRQDKHTNEWTIVLEVTVAETIRNKYLKKNA